MKQTSDDVLVREICTRLDASVAHLDPTLVTRLDRLRKDALAEANALAGPSTDTPLLQNVRNTLNNTLQLDAAIEQRLDDARRQAMARLRSQDMNQSLSLTARLQQSLNTLLESTRQAGPASMLATACVLVAVVSIFYGSYRPNGTLPLEDEISLIASAEDFELYENLDFYLWLAENGLPN